MLIVSIKNSRPEICFYISEKDKGETKKGNNNGKRIDTDE